MGYLSWVGHFLRTRLSHTPRIKSWKLLDRHFSSRGVDGLERLSGRATSRNTNGISNPNRQFFKRGLSNRFGDHILRVLNSLKNRHHYHTMGVKTEFPINQAIFSGG